MEMVAGMVDVGMEQEVGVGEEDVVFVDAEEDMVVEICNKSWVVTMAMVAQGHHLLKAVAVGVGLDVGMVGAVDVGVVGTLDQMDQSKQLPERL